MNGSISTILESLAIGLIETKINTRDLLKYIYEVYPPYIALVLSIIALILTVIGIPLVGIALSIAAIVLAAISLLSYETDYRHIKENSYSPQYLLNLVKITEYDLTLLNYEINLWNHLKD
jgi:hypothetical protein